MKIYNNVLTTNTIQKVWDEINQSRGENNWRVSTLFWGPDIKKGILGSTTCKEVSANLAEIIEGEIKHLLPSYGKLVQQIYAWLPASGISAHTDGKKKFGMTIYLNNNWQLDYGGLFVWEDKESNELKVRMPEFNSMVLNDNEELHLVTPVAFNSPVIRHTLQIWGL